MWGVYPIIPGLPGRGWAVGVGGGTDREAVKLN